MDKDIKKKREEFRQRIAETKRILNLPENVGWSRGTERNTHINNHIERENDMGRRTPKRPTLDELDHSHWE